MKKEFIVKVDQYCMLHVELDYSIYETLLNDNTIWLEWEGGDIPEGKELVISLKLRDKEKK